MPKLRDLAGSGTVGHDYGRSGIVLTVAHDRPHGGRADVVAGLAPSGEPIYEAAS